MLEKWLKNLNFSSQTVSVKVGWSDIWYPFRSESDGLFVFFRKKKLRSLWSPPSRGLESRNFWLLTYFLYYFCMAAYLIASINKLIRTCLYLRIGLSQVHLENMTFYFKPDFRRYIYTAFIVSRVGNVQ